MSEIKDALTKLLTATVKELIKIDTSLHLQVPENVAHGDYTTNVALVLFGNKELGIKNKGHKTPLEFAEAIRDNFKFQISNFKFLEKVEVVSPGFINFHLSTEAVISQVDKLLDGGEKTAAIRESQKIMVEFADPNPFKQFHIGHLRIITQGEALCRFLEAQGNTVIRTLYQGDVGMHVAKALYGMRRKITEGKEGLEGIEALEKRSLGERVKFLGEAYAVGASAYEEDEEAKKEIQAINKQVYAKDPAIMPLWEKGRGWSLEDFERLYHRVDTVYKKYYFESVTARLGKTLVESHIADGIFVRDQDAVVFKGEQYGLHTRVFITREGYATYEGKDMALAKLKYDQAPYDRSIIITATEQSSYFRVILKALALVYPDLAQKTEHFAVGFVNLAEGKMSSRTGNVITGEWLLDEAKEKIKQAFQDMDQETLEIVAVGAVKYSMLKFARQSDISFSFAESISLEGNSGPYIQYTYARTRSVLAKGYRVQGIGNSKYEKTLPPKPYPLNPEEEALLHLLYRFTEVVDGAAAGLAPNLVCNYLFSLAQTFNLFYQKHKILNLKVESVEEVEKVETGETENFRLWLTQATGDILKKGLYLLGIQAPQRM